MTRHAFFLGTLAAASLCCAAAAPASAYELDEGYGLYGLAGTTGVGLGVLKSLNPWFDLRAEFGSASQNRSYSESGIDYDAQVKLRESALYADYRPFSGVFHLTTGVSLSTPTLAMQAQPGPGGTIDINGTSYDATGQWAHAKVNYPSTMPYLGLGWSSSSQTRAGMSFGLDLGAFMGKAKGQVEFSDGLKTAAGSANIAAEQADFSSSVGKLAVWPVIKLAVGYRF